MELVEHMFHQKNLNEQDFIRVDIRSTRSLPIPDKFQIISSHNPKLLEKIQEIIRCL